MQKARRAARELALNIAYQMDVTGLPLDEAIETARENAQSEPEAFEYAESLIRGFGERRVELDSVIDRLSEGWAIDRQPAVDRNILRLAMYEMSHDNDVPMVVVVNEAVELAKKFSTAESGKFVNGVLAAYLREQEAIVPSPLEGEGQGEG